MLEPRDVTILVVDDEPDLRCAIAFDFKRKGYQVLEAGNGKEAFELLLKSPVDVVLSDVRMPHGDGIELLDKIKQRNVEKPTVIFITGFSDLSVEAAYKRGAEAVFSKPFDRKALLATITRSLADKSLWGARRTGERIDVRFPAELAFSELSVELRVQGMNISQGGLFIISSSWFPPVGAKTSFRLRLRPDDPRVIEGKGVVRWVRAIAGKDRPMGFGIQFERLDESNRTTVIEFINAIKTRDINSGT